MYVYTNLYITGRVGSLSLNFSDSRVYESQIRARLETTAQLCKAGVLKVRAAEAHYLFDRLGGCTAVQLKKNENITST